jgi:putative drug exporter of the RND superfamily
MPSIKVVPGGDPSRQGYQQVQAAFGAGAPGALQLVAPASKAEAVAAAAGRDPGIATLSPPQPGDAASR